MFFSFCDFRIGQQQKATCIALWQARFFTGTVEQRKAGATSNGFDIYKNGPIKITLGVGPFCTNFTLDYQPLSDLMDVATRNRTDILILIGPFVANSASQYPTEMCFQS